MQISSQHESCHRTAHISEFFSRRHFCRLIMIGGKAQFHFSYGDSVILRLIRSKQFRSRSIFYKYITERFQKVPGIIHIETRIKVVASFPFSQHQQRAVGDGTQRVERLFPKVEGNKVRRITTETIDTDFSNPKLHGFNHCQAHLLIIKV